MIRLDVPRRNAWLRVLRRPVALLAVAALVFQACSGPVTPSASAGAAATGTATATAAPGSSGPSPLGSQPGAPSPAQSSAPTPGGTPGPDASPQAGGDLAPLAVDSSIYEADLFHDSRNDLYRTPVGAVPAGTQVTLRLRAAAGDLSGAEVRVVDAAGTSRAVPMTVAATDARSGKSGYDYWAATLETTSAPALYTYWFVAHDGESVRYITDDSAQDGGTGQNVRVPPESGWQITAYEPGFTTPDWTRGAVVYQIFPDRYFNGDPSNDPSPTAKQGTSGAGVYRYGDVYGNPVLVKAWNELPEGYCRAYQGVTCTDNQPLGRDFYGGDLAGITAKLDDLADLGITAIYMNPIFAAPSNHRYDTSDYLVIDPDLGTLADFDTLVAGAKAHGIRVILDGVFNHVSSDSAWFDRMRRFDSVGACESADSPYRSWFTFRKPTPNEPSPCAPSTEGGDDTYYQGWFNFDTIPETQETPEVVAMITGTDGVVPYWLKRGIGGWRLDVADSISPAFLGKIRESAKAADPDGIVIAEQWGDSSAWLLGDQADSTMNYRFRRAVIGLINGTTADLDGSIDSQTPSSFAAQMLAVQEDYPRPAFDALLNMVDSHDTTRILWTLTPADDNAEAKADPAALAEGKRKLGLLATIQLTFPGMANIYYGDEVGLSGQDDPDDRRPYPWDGRDENLRDVYRTLARARADHPALSHGGLEFLLADDARNTLAYLRRTDAEAAITVLNLGEEERTLAIRVGERLPDGTALAGLLQGLSSTVTGGTLQVTIPPGSAEVLFTAPGSDLEPPAAPDGLTAAASPGTVSLEWSPVEGALGYKVLRSLVNGGGYQSIATTTDATFIDDAARNGQTAYYVIQAVDAAGNVSARSNEATALPALTLAEVVLAAPASGETILSASGEGTSVDVLVSVVDPHAGPAEASGVRVEVGIGPERSDPATQSGWTWARARFVGEEAGRDAFQGAVRPDAPTTFAVAVRASTDGGATWTYGDLDGSANGYNPDQAGRISAHPGDDTTPPATPTDLALVDVAEDHISLRWKPVDRDDVVRYLVLRAEGGSTEFTQIAAPTAPVFTDTSVRAGAEYAYAVVAQDDGFNSSPQTEPLSVSASKREVQLTFTVTVPTDTPAGDTVYIAGDFQGWSPAGTPMTRVDDAHWTITLPFEDATPLQYKYTRGSWDAVEKDEGCAEIANRTVTADFAGDGGQAVDDTVAKWRDIAGCP